MFVFYFIFNSVFICISPHELQILNPCQNQGTCVETCTLTSSYKCNCPNGYMGSNCTEVTKYVLIDSGFEFILKNVIGGGGEFLHLLLNSLVDLTVFKEVSALVL